MSEQSASKVRDVIMQVIAGVIIAGMVGIGSGIWRGYDILTAMELEVKTIKQNVARHESIIEKDMKRLESVDSLVTQRTEDHERRLARLESILDGIRNDIGEMKQDVKNFAEGNAQFINPKERRAGKGERKRCFAIIGAQWAGFLCSKEQINPELT